MLFAPLDSRNRRFHRYTDEGVDPAKLDALERTRSDQDKDDQYAEDDSKSQPLMCRTRRQCREDEMRFLWDNGGYLIHWSGSSRRHGSRVWSIGEYICQLPNRAYYA